MPKMYDVGDLVRLTCTFTNAAGTPTNPTTVVLKIREGDAGAIQSPVPVSDGTGAYHYDYSPLAHGVSVWYRWEGTGAVQTAEEGEFVTRLTHFA